MTVRELRKLLSAVENQDAEVTTITSLKCGKIYTTGTILGRYESPTNSTPKGFVVLTTNGYKNE